VQTNNLQISCLCLLLPALHFKIRPKCKRGSGELLLRAAAARYALSASPKSPISFRECPYFTQIDRLSGLRSTTLR
jgi:hypothetical protein